MQPKVLISTEEIADRVRALGAEISQEYADKDLVVVGILKGAVVFMSDLIRAIGVPLEIDFMATSSYGINRNLWSSPAIERSRYCH